MNEYLRIYEENGELIDRNSAEALNALRPEAARMLRGIRVPRRGDENFANIDMAEMLAPDYGIDLQAPDIEMNTGAFGPLPDGVEVGSLRDFARRHPESVAKYYGTVADLANPIASLNTLLVQDGLYLHVGKGVRFSHPLQLVNILDGATEKMVVRRVLVVIDDDAECRLMVCDHDKGDAEHLALETVEIIVGERARFDYYNLEETGEKNRRLSALYLRQAAYSQVNIDGITLYNGRTRNEYYCRFGGEEARLRLYGMGIEDRDRVLATYSYIEHAVPRCTSNELFKFTVDDSASGAFTGRIFVAPGAVKTEAYQANRNLVGAETAKMFSRPQLEIYNDDVKCSHGCAVGQLDQLQIFYMRTRGLSEAEAVLLLRKAFMSDVIDAIDNDGIRNRLHLLTERRFSGIDAACNACDNS